MGDQVLIKRVIDTLTIGVAGQVNIFKNLKEITEYPLESHQKVVEGSLEKRKVIWKDGEFFKLVEEYFQNSFQTLYFCPALKECLKHARDHASQLLTLPALQQFEEESEVGGSKYVIPEEFQSVRGKHRLMYADLEQGNYNLEKKKKNIHFWKKASKVICGAIFAVVSICISVTAAMGYTKVATALSPVVPCIPLVWKWIDSQFKNSESELNGQKEVTGNMLVGTHVAVKYLEDIQELITDIKAGMQKEMFIKNVEYLRVQADMYYRNVMGAEVGVLHRITEPPKKN